MSEHQHGQDQHSHQHGQDQRARQAQAAADGTMWTAAFWDERYAGSESIWSGNPNQRLVEQVTGLLDDSQGAGSAARTALDVGCGEGADAVWLAQQGWRTTGVDVSQVALDRAAGHAAAAGVEVEWRRVDVIAGEALPATYDLVSAHFLHPPADLLGEVVRRLGDAVAPGGTLLHVAHDPRDAAALQADPALVRLMPTLDQVVGRLDPALWDVQVAEVQARRQVRDGVEMTLHDTVVRAVKRAG